MKEIVLLGAEKEGQPQVKKCALFPTEKRNRQIHVRICLF